MSIQDQRAALAQVATIISGLATEVRDVKDVLGDHRDLRDVSTIRVEHAELRLDNAIIELGAALFALESLAAIIGDKPLLLPLLRTFTRHGDAPPEGVTALSYANHGKTDYVVRNPAGGWDLTQSLEAVLPATPGAAWRLTVKHINVTMTEVRR
jgi:hypothetical protein